MLIENFTEEGIIINKLNRYINESTLSGDVGLLNKVIQWKDKYLIKFENGKWNLYLGDKMVNSATSLEKIKAKV